MTEARIASKIWINGLCRVVSAEGGFATVLRSGDPVSGAILLVLSERGANQRILERVPSLDGGGQWAQIWPQAGDVVNEPLPYIERRVQYDPDIWVIELDIVDGERLVAQYSASG